MSVESWGGTITFERLAQGTKFIVRLPLAQLGIRYSGIPPGSRVKIIDDDESVIPALKRGGHVVLEAASTYAEGQTLLERHVDRDVPVLIDYRLDQEHLGTDLIAEFRGSPGLLLCTDDFDSPELVSKAQALGVSVLPKALLFAANT